MDTDNVISLIIIINIIISIIRLIIIGSIIIIVYYNNNICDLVFKNMLQLRPLSSVVFCQKYIHNNFF